MKRWFRVLIAIVLSSVLVACGARNAVPTNVVKKAIALDVNRTQQEIAQHLKLSAQPKVQIDRVKVSDQDPITVEGIRSYRVKGVYDFTLKLPKNQTVQRDNAFNVVLQPQADKKTWRSAQQPDGENWITSAIE